jgi:hypothetical protein
MKTTRSSILVPEVPGYTELQREMHDPRKARREGSQFPGTGWIAQLVHTARSVVAPHYDRTGCRRRGSGDPLRAQHPEWIEAGGKSPTCDYYESLFADLLVSHRAHARAHYDHLLNKTKTERPNDHEFPKNSRSFNGFRACGNRVDLVFFPRKSASRNSTGIRCADTPSTKGDQRL